MKPEFDRVLIHGTEQELSDYSEDVDRCIIVDWREEDDNIIAYVSQKIPEAPLSYVWDEAGALRVTYRGTETEIKLTVSLKDRYLVLRALNELLAKDYEMRVFRNSLSSDTHALYLKPRIWWEAMDQRYPERIQSVFAPLTEEIDFV